MISKEEKVQKRNEDLKMLKSTFTGFDWWFYLSFVVLVIIALCFNLNFIVSTLLCLIFAGIVIYVTYLKEKQENEKLKNTKIDEIENLTIDNFIKLIKFYYENIGYEVQEINTPELKDFDNFLIIKKGEEKNKSRFLIQINLNSKPEDFIEKAIYNKELLSEKTEIEKTVVATNMYYTKEERDRARKFNVYLIDKLLLIKIYLEYKGHEQSKESGVKIKEDEK